MFYNKDEFSYTFELVPSRSSKGKKIDFILNFAGKAANDKVIKALSITDNAGGNPALSPMAMGREIKSLGIEPIIHFSCKDKNRNMMESLLFELDRHHLRTLLVLTGDYPKYGIHGMAKPVFDIDSAHLLSIIRDMNTGFLYDPRVKDGIGFPPLKFYAGCVVSPFKRLIGEQIGQYNKLILKLNQGARFIITQMGFDARKFHECLMFLRQSEFSETPLIGTVFVPTIKLARIIYKNLIPGCIMPQKMLERFEKLNPKDELFFRIDLGAKLIALLKGMGFNGSHISIPELDYNCLMDMIEKSEYYLEKWEDLRDEFVFDEEWKFHYFKKDVKTGLNISEINMFDKSGIKADFSEDIHYKLSHLFHLYFFEKDKKIYNLMKDMLISAEDTFFEKIITKFEYLMKRMIYDCKECGDCALAALSYLCPQSQCAKYLFNGPCGGSNNGWCEVYPNEKKCIYVRKFERLEGKLEEETLNTVIPPRDWSLNGTSSWLNFYKKDGAEEGTRTPTKLPLPDPEPGASANSATSAKK